MDFSVRWYGALHRMERVVRCLGNSSCHRGNTGRPSALVQFAVLARGQAHEVAEGAGKIIRIVVADRVSDFPDRERGGVEQPAGVFQ